MTLPTTCYLCGRTIEHHALVRVAIPGVASESTVATQLLAFDAGADPERHRPHVETCTALWRCVDGAPQPRPPVRRIPSRPLKRKR